MRTADHIALVRVRLPSLMTGHSAGLPETSSRVPMELLSHHLALVLENYLHFPVEESVDDVARLSVSWSRK